MRKCLLFTICLFPYLMMANAQGSNIGAVIPTPNAASIGRFGEIPINYANGLPNISIPIYDLKYGGIEIPIALNYHPNAIGIEDHPGWTGLGWELDCGGVITRVVHGGPDDYKEAEGQPYQGYYYDGSMLNVSNWNDPTFMLNTCENNTTGTPTIDDSQPDEFFFRFGDISGSFFRDETGQWQVKSDQDVGLEVVETMNSGDFYLHQYNDNTYYVKLKSLFQQFTILSKDGTKYIFGGDENSIEFTRGPSNPYSITAHGYAEYVTPTAWYLTKVITPTGKEIDFTYARDAALFRKINSMGATMVQKIGGSSTCGGGTLTEIGGVVMNPVYLTGITTPIQRLEFTRGSSTQLEYPDLSSYEGTDQLNSIDYLLTQWPDLVNYTIHVNGPHDNQLPFGLYQQLNEIKLYDNIGNVEKMKYDFSYSSSSSQRLILNSLTIQSPMSTDPQVYQFTYNNVSGMPAYRSMQSDVWGFYNGINYSTTGPFFTFPGWRPVDVTKCQYGVLTSIKYPTGGHTDFVFESNKYSQHVQFQPSISLINDGSDKIVGGLRIKTITSYADFNSPPVTKQYVYVNNYPSGTTSSGIMGGVPFFYDVSNWTSPCPGTPGNWATALESDNALHPISATGNNSVNYNEVTEINGDNSYTVYKFSNFNNAQYMDESCNLTLGRSQTSTNDYAITSLDIERQKLLSKTEYNSSSTKVRDYVYTYNSDPLRKNNFIKAIKYEEMPASTCSGCFAADGYAIWPYKIYHYYDYLSKEVVTDYTGSSNNIVKTTQYAYDAFRNLISTTESQSDGRNLISSTLYNSNSTYLTPSSSDYYANAFYDIINKGIQDLPVEKITTLQDPVSGISKVIAGNVYLYYDGLPVIKRIDNLEISSPLYSNGSSINYYPSNVIPYSNFTENANYKTRATVNYLSNTSDILGITENTINTAYTRDYLQEYVTSVTKNANYPDVVYSSFEGAYSSSGSGTDMNKGNLEFDYTQIHSGDGITGNKCYNLSGGMWTRPSTLTVGNMYIVSFWSKTGSANANDGINPVTLTAGPTINGWTYYEATFIAKATSGTLTNIGFWGTGLIDEVRVYPANAEMTTYTYDPVFGVTSKCDQRSEITYYQYDDVGRLALEKDQDGNIVKKYEYGINTTE